MKYKITFFILITIIAATAILSYPKEAEKEKTNASILTGFATYTTKVCNEKSDSVFCYDKTFVECNGKRFEMPEKSNYLMQNKIYIPRECDNGIVLKETCGYEKNSPSDWIKENQIHVYPDRVTIKTRHPKFRTISNTNSMDPLIDEKTTIIEIPLNSEDELNIGDIVVYETKEFEYPLLHRIVNISTDEKGKYFVLKGDNNPLEDKEKVRFKQIQGVVVGILY